MPAVRHMSLAILLIVCACAVEDEVDVGAPSTAALDAPRLLIGATTWSAPPGGADGPSHVTAAWETPDGTRTPIDVGAPIVSAAEWNDGAAIVDAQRRLWIVAPDDTEPGSVSSVRGRNVQIASDVVSVASDGRTLVYVVVRDVLGEVHVRDAGRDVVVGRELASAGAFRFASPTRVDFVGSVNGGFAGEWTIDLAATQPRAECRTQCALRTGRGTP